MNKKLRLLLFEDCNRTCEGCCNKSWDLKSLSKVTSFKYYYQVMITGGEPMLDPELVMNVARKIREENQETEIILYTAKTNNYLWLIEIMYWVDGITITLHDQSDVKPFKKFDDTAPAHLLYSKSMRLNVFKGVDTSSVDTSCYKVKDNMEWIKDCTLPKNEVFMRW